MSTGLQQMNIFVPVPVITAKPASIPGIYHFHIIYNKNRNKQYTDYQYQTFLLKAPVYKICHWKNKERIVFNEISAAITTSK